jgi:PST family polysaccharide transporter
MASAPLIASFYKEPLLRSIVIAMGFTILFGGLSNQHQALLRRKMEFNKIASVDVAATLASVAIAIPLAYWGWGYWALVAKWLALPVVTTLGSWLLCRWRPGRPTRGVGVRPMLSFAFHTYGNFVLLYFSKTIDKMLVGRFFGSQALGNYDRAYQFSNMLPSQLLSPLNSVAMSAFSRLSNDPVKYRHTYLTLLSTLAFVSMPASAILALTGKDLIVFLLGPQWESAGRMFGVFGLSIGIMVLYYTSGWLHLSLGTPDRWLRWASLSFVVTGLLFLAGLPFGPLGVAAAYSIALYILAIPALWYAGRPIDLKVSRIVSAVGKEFISALAAGLLCWAVIHNSGSISGGLIADSALVRVLVSPILCLSVYLALVLALHRSLKPISQLIGFVRDMLPKLPSRKGL